MKQSNEEEKSLRQFQVETSPTAWNVDYPHIELLRTYLDRVTSGELKRLAVFMPPRHGKSENLTVRYPVYRLERDPRTRSVIAAYNQTLASKFSRKARRIAEQRFPLATDRTAVDDWETPQGGGVRAVGVGGGITGMGFDLLLIDDPVKSREEAESEVYREKVWTWYTDDLYTRCEPGAAIILVMTRWHGDDLAGRILNSEQAGDWEVLNLPAIAEEDDPLGREIGAALCPERYDLAALADIQRTLQGYSFNALYQQRPSAREGSFFKVGNIQVVDALPAVLKSCRAWDLAATEGDGDFTAGVKISRDTNGFFYVADVTRGQWGAEDVEKYLRLTAQLDGPTIKIHIPQDPGQAGKKQAGALARMLAGFPVKTESISGDKETRAFAFAAQVNAGNVRMLRADWNRAFIEELRQFPSGKFDDQVDSSADAFNEIAVDAYDDWA